MSLTKDLMGIRNLTLHRVKIKNIKGDVVCPVKCSEMDICLRCNEFYKKCTIYKKSKKDKIKD